MTEQELTPSGQPIKRYLDHKEKPLQPVTGETDMEAIVDHVEKHLGTVETVFHEVVSDIVHIDVNWVKPNAKFPFHILVTSGMSDKPMTVPVGQESNKYAELCVILPADWIIGDKDYAVQAFDEEKNYWPFRCLKLIARFPHEYDTWVGWGHTIPNGEAAEPYAENTNLGCILLLPGLSLPKEFFELKITEEKTIKFYCLYPLFKEEMEFKLNNGTDALLAKFDKHGIRDIVDIDRPNTCAKKKSFGLW